MKKISKKKNQKLNVARETLLQLTNSDLGGVQGGTTVPSCVSTSHLHTAC
jgi:hypothetical protein